MNSLLWRQAHTDDLDAVMAIQDEVHALLPERREVFADKMRLFGEGCLILEEASGPAGSDSMEHDVVRKPVPTVRHHALGYGIAHPWRLGDVPPLDVPLGILPAAADCLFIHDVALRAEARGQGAGGAFVRRMRRVAHARNLGVLALVSVYGTVPLWERCGFGIVSGAIPPENFAGYGDSPRYMTADIGDEPLA